MEPGRLTFLEPDLALRDGHSFRGGKLVSFRYIRNRLWINPAFQARVLLRIGFYFLLYLLLVWHLGFLLFLGNALAADRPDRGIVEQYVAYLWDLRPLLLASAVVAPYFIYDLIKFSHRVAGPFYRCQKIMRDMAAGKAVPEFHPRKHDLMPDFFEDFNALIKAWNGRVRTEANGHPPAANPREMPTRQVPSAAGTHPGEAP